jgi:glycosyltransferase involved in cell wall biosynthesis
MISVTILTKNSQKYLREVLESVRDFDEVVICDTGSSDLTLSIAAEFPNVAIHRKAFIGFGPTHNEASSLAKHDWILSIDSDEVVSPEMTAAIKALHLEQDCVYSFPRHNYYNGKFIRWCGWYPDRQMRLYNRQKTQFSDAQVHEAIIAKDCTVLSVEAPIIHYSYSTHSDFLAKMQSYSDLFARQYAGRKKSSPSQAVLHGFFAFLKSYVLKRGFLGGYEGFIISIYNGNTAFYKYLKLFEANRQLEK